MNTVSKMIAAALSVGGASAQVLLAASLTAIGTVPAHAQSVQVNSVRVVHADLDLSTQAGNKTLALRIGRAADKVCERPSDSLDISGQRAYRTCRESAIAKATASVASRGSTQVVTR